MENSINYNQQALVKFNKLMDEIKYINEDLTRLKEVAVVCSQQNMTAIVTLTVLDNAKYEYLNQKTHRELMLKKMNDSNGGAFFAQQGAPGRNPQFTSKEDLEAMEMMEQNRRNAALSTFQVNTENYPSISLKILNMLKEGLVEQRNKLQEEANIIYKEVFAGE